MNKFTIKDIENLSGIKAHTWRIWEQRYKLALPHRKDSNHRFYDNDNLKLILRISYLYHEGFKISKIAALEPEEIKNRSLQTLVDETGIEFYIEALFEAAIDLDEDKFEQNFDEAIRRLGLEEAIIKVLYTFQKKIGFLWLTDHLIPAQEHFTSNIIRQKLAVAIEKLPKLKEAGKKIFLLFTPEHEHHEIPLQFIHFLLKKNGHKVVYLGSDVSIESIETCSKLIEFTHVFFHLVTNLTSKNANEYLHELSERFQDKKIVMSGIEVEKITEIPGNAQLLRSLDEMLKFTSE